jgi:hypothetical protein
MSIVTRNQSLPQFRCLPLVGREASFRYVQMINGTWQTINHGQITQAVGQFGQARSTGR